MENQEVTTMEEWLAEVLELDQDPNSISQLSFDESSVAALKEDFGNPHSSRSNTSFTHENVNDNIMELFASPPYTLGDDNTNNKINKNGSSNLQQNREKTATKKRNRQPSQVQDHIIAERKRREVISQRFIALSAIVPGLKKIDKTSILEESIKYMKQLQEKVKVLEEDAIKRNIESMVMVKKSRIVIDDDNDTSSIIDGNSTCSSGGGNGNGNDGNLSDTLPEVQINISDKILFLRVYCYKQKGILSKLFAEVEKHDVSVVNCGILPFRSLALDVTIVAQMEKGFNKNVKDLIEDIHSALSLASN